MVRLPNKPLCLPIPPTKAKKVLSWQSAATCDHFVQFYRTDDYLIDCLAGFIAEGLWKNERAVVIATPSHRIALEDRLRVKGVDVLTSVVQSQYLALDAHEMLSKFMVRGKPDHDAFMSIVGELVRKMTEGGQRLRAFGEMVALLWMDGHRAAAIELEGLWNELGRKHSFTLFCAYPAQGLTPSSDGLSLEHICDVHAGVISLTA